MEQDIIQVRDVSMMFNLSTQKVDSLKEYFIRRVKGQLRFQEFWALQNVSFDVKKGSSLGIIGLNGSGKSTLLKIISGIMKPTQGEVRVLGNVSPLIELGAGFDADLSARENVYLNGAVLGYRKEEIKERFEEIIEFAELWDFLDTPIKNFSSGMIARLGFSIATLRNPDILIVDEILEVGDFKFRQKCRTRMEHMMADSASVIMVSHSIDTIKRMCDNVVWLEKGKVQMIGDAETVCDQYIEKQ